MKWYYANESDQRISFAEGDFKGLIDLGSIQPETLVWNPKMPGWKEASLVRPGMFGFSENPGDVAEKEDIHAPGIKAREYAFASLICGIFSVLLSCTYGMGLLPGIAAVVCGNLSKRKMAKAGHSRFANTTTAGLITGYAGTAISILFFGFLIVAIANGIGPENGGAGLGGPG